jgi:hypothetical protein
MMMPTQYNQFLEMLDNIKRFSPRAYGSKNTILAHDPHFDVVEMSSSAGTVMLGFSKETGKLMDVIGPLLLPWQDRRCQARCEELDELGQAHVFHATAS